MPKQQSWSGGTVKIDTADKKHLVKAPQQQHNLSQKAKAKSMAHTDA